MLMASTLTPLKLSSPDDTTNLTVHAPVPIGVICTSFGNVPSAARLTGEATVHMFEFPLSAVTVMLRVGVVLAWRVMLLSGAAFAVRAS
jgi:hypothetical protein